MLSRRWPNEDTFQLSVDNVLKAISEKTAAVLIDSPNNPTGAVYTATRWRDWPMFCARPTLSVILRIRLCSSRISRTARSCTVPEVPWVPSIYENTVVYCSYSKSLSLPGERVGWIWFPTPIRRLPV